jgi:hypothetical protein
MKNLKKESDPDFTIPRRKVEEVKERKLKHSR